MGIVDLVNKEVENVFKGYKFSYRSEFVINADGVVVKLLVLTTSGKILSIADCIISGLEELQYAGDVVDLIKDKLTGLLFLMKREAAKEGTELVKEVE